MGMHKIAKMPSPEELKEEMPLSEEAKQIKAARDKEIRDVFTGASDKFLVIIGPCSADNETAVMDYLGRLARVQKDLADKLLIIPRIYTDVYKRQCIVTLLCYHLFFLNWADSRLWIEYDNLCSRYICKSC